MPCGIHAVCQVGNIAAGLLVAAEPLAGPLSKGNITMHVV
jgi:hypothetical protein